MVKYSFVDNSEDGITHIRIEEGVFVGIVYKYGKVSFGEDTGKGHCDLNFAYYMVDNANMIINEHNGKEFINVIGDILVDIIEKQIQQSK